MAGTHDYSIRKPDRDGRHGRLRRGKEKGKRGIVKAVFPKAGTATVEGINVVKRHTKPGQAARAYRRHLRKGSAAAVWALAGHRSQNERATRVRRIRQTTARRCASRSRANSCSSRKAG